MKILAIDFGEKRLGTALGDTETGIAFPREILDNNVETNQKISNICQDDNVLRVLVGLPVMLLGHETVQTEAARVFAEQLEDFFLDHQQEIPVDFIDERFSSQSARAAGAILGLSERKLRGKIDSAAAALFLQQFLDTKRPD